ncbi:HopJ type III effector domain containing protein [Nitzschia inconspicua]|uniref:HopJ type III effector domain containing protein n=1 Tax=Nitzschia inconspicua TaxID=303405 RepID=A0A9K3KWU1_9STRA|nr:HopJ type III effector domain containing protein [Nitzschia inconspicua]
MKFSIVTALYVAAASTSISKAFSPPSTFGGLTVVNCHQHSHTSLFDIRPKTDKSKELRFGWDGTTALGGAVENAKPARMLDEIRASGETIPDECKVFNANVEMNSDDLKFEDVMNLIDTHYEVGLIEFRNGDMINKQGENEGSGKLLSYAALSKFDKETTLKLWGQYYREVLADPDGDSHQNIRNFMKYGWDGVPFENGISLTKKNVGDSDWDWDAESWIP